MNRYLRRAFALALPAAFLFSFAACKSEKTPPDVSGYTYTPGESASQSSTEAPAAEDYAVNTAWQASFAAEYKYFDKNNGSAPVTIRETRTAGAFAAVYPETGNLVYYKENGADIDCYTVIPGEKQYVHNVLKGKKLKDLSSTYMKLTSVDAGLPKLANVLYMQDDTVAGRPCKKYIQRAYTDGSVTETVYVWVDAEYGFALKCEDYNAADELQVSWETVSFSVNGVTEADAGVNLSDYTFTEGK